MHRNAPICSVIVPGLCHKNRSATSEIFLSPSTITIVLWRGNSSAFFFYCTENAFDVKNHAAMREFLKRRAKTALMHGFASRVTCLTSA